MNVQYTQIIQQYLKLNCSAKFDPSRVRDILKFKTKLIHEIKLASIQFNVIYNNTHQYNK